MTDPVAVEMQAIVRLASQPWEPGDSVKVAIARAADVLNLSYRRARSFWYLELVAVRAVEADRMRAAERVLLAKRYRLIQHELAAIEVRLDRLDALEEAKASQFAARLAIEARLDAGNEPTAGAAAALAGKKVREGGEATDVAQRKTDCDGAVAGAGGLRPWPGDHPNEGALRDDDGRRP